MPTSDKSTGTSTTTTSQPGYNEILGTVNKLFNSSLPWAPDTTNHVTPFSGQTMFGLNQLENTSKGVMPEFQQNFNRVNATVGDGGLNSLQDRQISRLENVANGNGLNSMQQTAYNRLNPIAGGTGYNKEQQSAVNYLNPIASGKMLGGNPYLDEVIKRTSDDIGNSTNLQASAAGRYGSGVHQGVLADSIGDMSANLRYGDYNAERSRMDNAINSLFGMGTTGQGQKMNAIGAQAGLGTTGQNQRMDAVGSLFNAGTQQRENQLKGTGQLSDAYMAQLDPMKSILGVGKAFEQKNQDVINDQTRALQDRQQSMLDPVNWAAQLANMYRGGSTVTTGTQPNNTFGNVLGGALSGYDIFGGPLGAVGGGLMGLFS